MIIVMIYYRLCGSVKEKEGRIDTIMQAVEECSLKFCKQYVNTCKEETGTWLKQS